MTGWLRATGAATVAAVALASCGGDGNGADDATRARSATVAPPEVVLRRYYTALGRADAATACALMTPAAQEAMTELPEGRRARSCGHAVALLARADVALRAVEVHDLKIRGANATARVTSKSPRYDSGVVLRRDASGWKIAYPPGVVTRFDTPPGVRPHEDEGKR
jgi:hypothetical protein